MLVGVRGWLCEEHRAGDDRLVARGRRGGFGLVGS